MKRPLLSLKGQAMALLARREHSRAELRTKLLAHVRKMEAVAAEAARQASSMEDPLAAFLRPDLPAPVADDGDMEHDHAAAAALVDEALDWLESKKYLSDTRFVEARVATRAPRFGQARIKHELGRLGVTMDADTAQNLRDTELQRAREVFLKRFQAPAEDPAGRAKQMRFLASRGFGADTVRRVIGGRDDD